MKGKWGLFVFIHTLSVFPSFPEIIFELSQKTIRLHPSWFHFLMSPRVMLMPQGLFCWPIGLLLCDLPPGQRLLCCPTAASLLQPHKDVQLHLPGDIGAPDHMQMIFSARKGKKNKQGDYLFKGYLFSFDQKPNISKESKQFS